MKIKQLSIFLQNKEGSLYDALEILTKEKKLKEKEIKRKIEREIKSY